jgi:hypothetical protein
MATHPHRGFISRRGFRVSSSSLLFLLLLIELDFCVFERWKRGASEFAAAESCMSRKNRVLGARSFGYGSSTARRYQMSFD